MHNGWRKLNMAIADHRLEDGELPREPGHSLLAHFQRLLHAVLEVRLDRHGRDEVVWLHAPNLRSYHVTLIEIAWHRQILWILAQIKRVCAAGKNP